MSGLTTEEVYEFNHREIGAEEMTKMTDDWDTCYNDCRTYIDNITKKTYKITQEGLKEHHDITFGEYDEYEEGKKCSLC